MHCNSSVNIPTLMPEIPIECAAAHPKSIPFTGPMCAVEPKARPAAQFHRKNISAGKNTVESRDSKISAEKSTPLSARDVSGVQPHKKMVAADEVQKKAENAAAAKIPKKANESAAVNTANAADGKKFDANRTVSDITHTLVSIKNPKLSVRALPNGNDFYFERQINGNVCGLCALRNLVGAPWISVNALNGIKSGHFSGQAVVATARDHIVSAIANLRKQMEQIVAKNPSQKINKSADEVTQLVVKMEQLMAESHPNGREVVNAIDAFARKLADVGLSGSRECKDLQRQRKNIIADCLEVSSGGLDPKFALNALQLIDPNATFHCDEKPLNYSDVTKFLDAKNSDRAIVCASGHFVAVRKDAGGRWYVLDSQNSSPVAMGGNGGPRSGQRYSGIIYLLKDSLDPERIKNLADGIGWNDK
ncbi:MAG: Josephin domain-containing protein [Puniceicoccales bacterium]|nr:Josephin domain-containing protein [Puniceicoccales bacterium]